MLHRHDGWRRKFAHRPHRRVGILDVVVRQLLAVQLLGAKQGEVGGWDRIPVEGRLLVAVFPVAQVRFLIKGQGQRLSWRSGDLLGQVTGDHGVVSSGVAEGLRGQIGPQFRAGVPSRL